MQVDKAEPVTSEPDSKGVVRFIVYSEIEGTMTPIGTSTLSQFSFIHLLKSGDINFKLVSGFVSGERYIKAQPNYLPTVAGETLQLFS